MVAVSHHVRPDFFVFTSPDQYFLCRQMSEKLRFFDPQLKEKPEKELFDEPEWLIHLRQLDGQIKVTKAEKVCVCLIIKLFIHMELFWTACFVFKGVISHSFPFCFLSGSKSKQRFTLGVFRWAKLNTAKTEELRHSSNAAPRVQTWMRPVHQDLTTCLWRWMVLHLTTH